MRPKKVILLVSPDCQQLSEMAFLLHTHGYKVITQSSAAEALGLFPQTEVHLVIAAQDLGDRKGADLLELLKKIIPYVPTVILGTPAHDLSTPWANAVVDPLKTTAADLLERLRLLTARKRGPRKGSIPWQHRDLAPKGAPVYDVPSPSALA
jgi:DNA-binding NtrC family response regulator